MQDFKDTRVEELGFSTRTINCLKRARINTLAELWMAYKEGRLIKIRSFGMRCLKEVEEKLNEVM